MNTRLVLVATALAASIFQAQAQPSVVAPGINAPAYQLAAPKAATWPKALVGVWQARKDDAAGTLEGTLILNADKSLVLEPVGMFTLKGYWFVMPGQKLLFDTPLDKAEINYDLSDAGSVLVLTYSNGAMQRFERAVSAQSNSTSKKK